MPHLPTPIARRARHGLAWLLAAWLLIAAAHAAPAPDTVQLEDLTWTELRGALQAGKTTALIPIGGTEQSGPYLALGKHNARARALAERIARALGDALVAPVVAYVPEGSIAPPSAHMRFAGTISVPAGAFEQTLTAAAQSLQAHGFRTIVLLGDHGGYQASLARVAQRLDQAWRGKGVRALAPHAYYQASSSGFAALLRARGYGAEEIGTHAALADSALQLALAPDTVRAAALRDAPTPTPGDGIHGGNPRRASAALGELGAELIVSRTVEAIRHAVPAR